MFSKPGAVLTAGFFALDVILYEDQLIHRAGGTAANVAANLAFLGWDSTAMALLGKDPAGAHLMADLTKSGVATNEIRRRDDVVTPVVVHEILAGRHRFRFGCPDCGRRFPRIRPFPSEDVRSLLEGATPHVFFFDRVSSAAVETARHVRDAQGLVVFEPAMPSDRERFRSAVDLAHIVKFSNERKKLLIPLLDSTGPDTLQVMTAGLEGAYWRRGTRRWNHESGFATTVFDAGGAGDWTTAGLVAATGGAFPSEMSDGDVSKSLQVAQALAALSCRYPGSRGVSEAQTPADLTDSLMSLMNGFDAAMDSPQSMRGRSRRQAACSSCLAPH